MANFKIQTWNMPPGGVRMLCPDCRGEKVTYVSRQFISSDGEHGTVTHPVPCSTCSGRGVFPQLAPPA